MVVGFTRYTTRTLDKLYTLDTLAQFETGDNHEVKRTQV
jgi:hypothetical protein